VHLLVLDATWSAALGAAGHLTSRYDGGGVREAKPVQPVRRVSGRWSTSKVKIRTQGLEVARRARAGSNIRSGYRLWRRSDALGSLVRQYLAAPIALIWDNLNASVSTVMPELIGSRDWLREHSVSVAISPAHAGAAGCRPTPWQGSPTR
jgi:hypothetical protein